MKRYKVVEVIRMLEADGWYLIYCKRRPPTIQAYGKKRESDGKRKDKHYNVSRVIK